MLFFVSFAPLRATNFCCKAFFGRQNFFKFHGIFLPNLLIFFVCFCQILDTISFCACGEMADTLLSGGSERKLVRVQVSPSAPLL